MTIAAYQTLYESSIAFGMRKALMAEHRKAEMEAKVKQLEAEKEDTLKKKADLEEAMEEALADREAENQAWVANKSFEISKFKFKFPRARTFELIRARSRL